MKRMYDYIVVKKDGKKEYARNAKEAIMKSSAAGAYVIICKLNSVKRRTTPEVEQKDIIHYRKYKNGPKRQPERELQNKELEITLEKIAILNEILEDERHIWYGI